MRLHPGNAVLQTSRRDDGVRVQDEGVLAPCLHDGLVVGTGKAHILLVLDIGDLRVALTREGDAVVPRQVIDDNHLAGHALHGLFHRAQGLLQQVLDAVVDDDDGQFHIACGVGHDLLVLIGQCGTDGCAVAGMLGDVEAHAVQAFHHREDIAAFRQLCQVADEHKVLDAFAHL